MALRWQWKVVDERSTPLDIFIRIVNKRLSDLSGDLKLLFQANASTDTFANGATTPSIYGSKIWKTANTVGTSITTFLDGQEGTEVLVWSTDVNTTLVHSAGFRMKLAANVTMTAVETRRFATVDGTNWREL